MGVASLHDSPARVLALKFSSYEYVFERTPSFVRYEERILYPENLIITALSEVIFEDRKLALQQKQKENKRIFTQYQPSVPNLKQILMKNWHLIQRQPFLSEIYKDTPLI